MAYKTQTREMICPRCKERFEEGSRRFCPTDGARLISDVMEGQRSSTGGIFSNLLPKINAETTRDETLREAPTIVKSEQPAIVKSEAATIVKPQEPAFVINDNELDLFNTEPPQRQSIKPPADPFFEIADLKQPDPEPVPTFTMPEQKERELPPPPITLRPGAPKPVARKVNPYDIPAGHVELGDSE